MAHLRILLTEEEEDERAPAGVINADKSGPNEAILIRNEKHLSESVGACLGWVDAIISPETRAARRAVPPNLHKPKDLIACLLRFIISPLTIPQQGCSYKRSNRGSYQGFRPEGSLNGILPLGTYIT
ncbi:hypothetical protein J6590_001894 [Homalodisca vitripennis]|nr:hypothetical protein J6590_001894 [Homalodisca vitripennis]